MACARKPSEALSDRHKTSRTCGLWYRDAATGSGLKAAVAGSMTGAVASPESSFLRLTWIAFAACAGAARNDR
jgi:hypothetical protein